MGMRIEKVESRDPGLLIPGNHKYFAIELPEDAESEEGTNAILHINGFNHSEEDISELKQMLLQVAMQL